MTNTPEEEPTATSEQDERTGEPETAADGVIPDLPDPIELR
ncbi:hypothetical protein ABT288_49520 [Streptomyces sp. NPDC001093]